MTPFHFGAPSEANPNERRIEVPAHLATKAELLAFLASAFPLPAYFGHNWDALEECLLDLDWLKDPQVALIHHDIPLAPAPRDKQIYLRILAQAAETTPRLQIIFPADTHVTIKSLLSE